MAAGINILKYLVSGRTEYMQNLYLYRYIYICIYIYTAQEWRELLVGLAFWTSVLSSLAHCARPDL